MTEELQFTLGRHVRLGEEFWLPVRFVQQSTFHEEPRSGTSFIEQERFVELRNSKGAIRFVSLDSERLPAVRDPGPCRGIKPYFWQQGGFNAPYNTTIGSEGDSEGDHHDSVAGGEGQEGQHHGGDGGGEPTPPDPGMGDGIGNGPVSEG